MNVSFHGNKNNYIPRGKNSKILAKEHIFIKRTKNLQNSSGAALLKVGTGLEREREKEKESLFSGGIELLIHILMYVSELCILQIKVSLKMEMESKR